MRKTLPYLLGFAFVLAFTACDDTGGGGEGKPEDDGKIVDGKEDAWNYTNNPERFRMEFEYKYDALAEYTVGEAEQTPWPSDYWSYYEDSTNTRYHGINTLSPTEKYDKAFNGWTPNMDLRPMDVSADCSFDGTIMDTHDDYYDHLGPASLWQHQNKGNYRARDGRDNDNDGTVDECRSGDYDGIETWWGLCHAWVPAAVLEPEPIHPVTVNGVEFTVSDIKALLITMYDRSSALMMGGRCNEKEIKRDEHGRIVDEQEECRDTNPGAFHVTIVNMLGIQKRAFAEDKTAGYQVWNQPVRGYEIREAREVTEAQAMELLGRPGESYLEVFDSPNCVSWRHVRMTTKYITESSNTTEGPLVPNIGQYTRNDNYEYILELDADGKIVGGEWVGSSRTSHPDFLWLPIRQTGGNPYIDFAQVKNLLELSRADESVTPDDEECLTFEREDSQAIPDNDPTGVTSTLEVTEDVPIGSLKVKVELEHTYIGDLRVVLRKDGTEAVLHDRQGGGTDNLSETYSVTEFDAGSTQGTWELVVTDHAGRDTGHLIKWSLHVAGSDLPATNVHTFESTQTMTIPDNDEDGITSTLAIGEDGSVKNLTVKVNITHTYIGDLTVTLHHNGSHQILHSREGGSTDDLVKSFKIDSFNGAPIRGDWELKVNDQAGQDTGTLNGWSMEVEL